MGGHILRYSNVCCSLPGAHKNLVASICRHAAFLSVKVYDMQSHQVSNAVQRTASGVDGTTNEIDPKSI